MWFVYAFQNIKMRKHESKSEENAQNSSITTYRRGRRVLSSLSTRSMPKILVPLFEIIDTKMSMTEMSTSIPSKIFQLLFRYDFSPKHHPRATTFNTHKHIQMSNQYLNNLAQYVYKNGIILYYAMSKTHAVKLGKESTPGRGVIAICKSQQAQSWLIIL